MPDLEQLLPQHERLYAIGLISARIKILPGYTLEISLLSKMSLNVITVKLFFVLVKISFRKIYVVGPTGGGFQFLLI